MEDVYLLSAARTPIGSFLGTLKELPAPKLGAAAISAAVSRASVKPDAIDECLMGCVLTAGIGQAPTRQAAIYAGLPQSVRCTTLNRVCGSGLKTVMLATQAIQCGDAEVCVAGGMESMSHAPYLLDRMREGYRLGHGKIIDSMIHDGLWDPYSDQHMGDCAELCALEREFTREEQDRYAIQSYRRAQAAITSGKFHAEIAHIELIGRKGEKRLVDRDEEPHRATIERFAELKPAFQKTGTVTAANASSLSDGAAALVVASGKFVKHTNATPLARVIAQASHAQAPQWFTTAPVGSIRKVLEKANMELGQIDLFEVNEAFSVVALACAAELGISEDKLNVHGGAVALGHPIGASGARILTTLVHALQQNRKRYGIASICIGGGEASALLIEVLVGN